MKKKLMVLFPLIGLIISGCSYILPANPDRADSVLWEDKPLPSATELDVTAGGHNSKEELVDLTGEAYDMFLKKDDINWAYEYSYVTGDSSMLSDRQLQVLNSVIPVVSACRGMAAGEKVRYIHDYLTSTVVYGFLDDPYSEYGALVEHKAVCQGYAYAFKLCMDLLRIPCITVGGTADNGSGEVSHAWNMVQLDDSWYHVDVTWDDAVTTAEHGSWCHLYFLVDDTFMSQNHVWTDMVQGLTGIDRIPAADDMSLFYYDREDRLFTDQLTLKSSFEQDFNSGIKKMEYCCKGFVPDTSFIGYYSAGEILYQSVGEYVILFINLE